MSRWLLIFLLVTSPCWAGVDLDGTDDSIGCGDIAAMDLITELSGCAWVYHDSLTDDDYIFERQGAGGLLLLRDDVGSGSGRTDMYKIFVQETSGAGGANANIESATNSSPSATWTHVCFTAIANTAGGLELYINGAEDANSPVTTSGLAEFGDNAQELYIGSADGTSNYFNGKIGSASLWTTRLTEAEVVHIYNSKVLSLPLQIQPSSLILHVEMQDAADGAALDLVTVRDSSSAGNDCNPDDGANNTGMLAAAEEVLSYP